MQLFSFRYKNIIYGFNEYDPMVGLLKNKNAKWYEIFYKNLYLAICIEIIKNISLTSFSRFITRNCQFRQKWCLPFTIMRLSIGHYTHSYLCFPSSGFCLRSISNNNLPTHETSYKRRRDRVSRTNFKLVMLCF